ncbi:MAG TPA: hypothetical protein ENN28_00235 [Candidatus Uhrbacteria bacterium]|nr:hypothetical protein [Candidatus Uhrbacteria bacterium]
MKKTKIILIIITILLVFNLFTPASLAGLKFGDATRLMGKTSAEAGVVRGSLPGIAASIIQFLLGLVGIIFFILFLYGGFAWMTAGGSEEKIIKAKKIIINAVIGLAIVILAYSITYFIASALEATPATNQ